TQPRSASATARIAAAADSRQTDGAAARQSAGRAVALGRSTHRARRNPEGPRPRAATIPVPRYPGGPCPTAETEGRPDSECTFLGGYQDGKSQELLGHQDVHTTMIYTPVMQKGVAGVRSPLDWLKDLSGDDVRAALE